MTTTDLDPEITRLLAHAKARFDALSPDEQAAFVREARRDRILAEAYLGSDVDEAAFAAAMASDDAAEMERLSVECRERRRKAAEVLDKEGWA